MTYSPPSDMSAEMPAALELLAPARDADTAIAAIVHGADAVYIGGPSFGARAAAGNSLDDLRRVVEYARPYGVKVYVTFNTIIYDSELVEARRLVAELYEIGVDALIVQDMALTAMDILPIELHASTQTDARTPAKVAMLARAGFSQIVLPREFSLDEIRAAAEAAPDTGMEVFVHGALCVCYSGDCQAGYVATGRSANRGECPQICRLEYRLEDADGRELAAADSGRSTRHWLSLADMNRLPELAALADAGARSFKIEGRLKGPAYVKEVTAAYSAALDRLVEESGGRYRRSSYGRSRAAFAPDVSAVFNRGFTPYFLRRGDDRVSSTLTPKYTGPKIGTYLGARGAAIRVKTDIGLHAGDGLGWYGDDGRFRGFRVNRAEPGLVYPAPGSDVPRRAGTALYRNLDAARDSLLARPDTATRRIALRLRLSAAVGSSVALHATDERGISAEVTAALPHTDTARSPQQAYRRDIFSRLGDTSYELEGYTDDAGDIFIPAKELAALRRSAAEALDAAWAARPRATRRRSTLPPDALAGYTADYHDNVANRLAADFYRSHGARIDRRALEVEPPTGEVRVMTTRYCLRREQGECLREPGAGRRWPAGDLYLRAPLGRLRLHFDCANCRMQVHAQSKHHT